MKRQPTEWEKIFANGETDEINFKNIQLYSSTSEGNTLI